MSLPSSPGLWFVDSSVYLGAASGPGLEDLPRQSDVAALICMCQKLKERDGTTRQPHPRYPRGGSYLDHSGDNEDAKSAMQNVPRLLERDGG